MMPTTTVKKLQKWSLIVGLFVAVPTIVAWPMGMAETLLEHVQQVGANTQYIQMVEFKRLENIRQQRKLTVVEWNNWCRMGKALGYWKSCPLR
jgi:hypothetical protein|tara:strand:+ start:54070 stop:54348 length:279 start_codon:yes stop_codon:yes gene_type:complete